VEVLRFIEVEYISNQRELVSKIDEEVSGSELVVRELNHTRQVYQTVEAELGALRKRLSESEVRACAVYAQSDTATGYV
jgi:hypothetical protein